MFTCSPTPERASARTVSLGVNGVLRSADNMLLCHRLMCAECRRLHSQPLDILNQGGVLYGLYLFFVVAILLYSLKMFKL